MSRERAANTGGANTGGRSREGFVHTRTQGASGEVALEEREWEVWRRRERVVAGGGGGCTHKQIKMATWTHDFGVCERACIQNPSFKIPSPRADFQTSEIPSTWNRRRPFDNDSPTPKRQWAPRWNALPVTFFAHPPIPPICRTPFFPYLTLYSWFSRRLRLRLQLSPSLSSIVRPLRANLP